MKEEYTLFEWLLGFTLFITIFWSLIGWRFKDAKKYEDFASSNVPGGTPLVRQFAILKQNNIRCKLITLSGGPRGMVCYGGNNQITQVLKVNKDDSYNARKILEEIDG